MHLCDLLEKNGVGMKKKTNGDHSCAFSFLIFFTLALACGYWLALDWTGKYLEYTVCFYAIFAACMMWLVNFMGDLRGWKA